MCCWRLLNLKFYIVTPNLEVWAMFVRMYELRVVWACDGKYVARQTNWSAQSPPKCCCCLPPCLLFSRMVGVGGQTTMLLKWSWGVAQQCDICASNMCKYLQTTSNKQQVESEATPASLWDALLVGKEKSLNQIKMQDEAGRFEMASPKDV